MKTRGGSVVAFRLPLDQPQRGIVKVARAQLARLQSAPSILGQRKSLKKLRALHRLGTTPSNAKAARQCDRLLRDTGRALGPARDGTALRDTLSRLVETGLLTRRSLVQILKAELDQFANEDSSVTIDIAFDAITAQVAAMDYSRVTLASLIAAAGQSYRAARRGRRRALTLGGSDAAHDWRKSVQRHARHMQLLADLWPADLELRITTTKEIARSLGDEHDLHLLGVWLEARHLPKGEHRAAAALQSAIRKRQRQLRDHAFALGAKVFAERPRCFRARLSHYAKVQLMTKFA